MASHSQGLKRLLRHILCFVQTLVSAIYQIKFIIIKWISIRKNNCIVLWLSIYPVDSANPPFDQLELELKKTTLLNCEVEGSWIR